MSLLVGTRLRRLCTPSSQREFRVNNIRCNLFKSFQYCGNGGLPTVSRAVGGSSTFPFSSIKSVQCSRRLPGLAQKRFAGDSSSFCGRNGLRGGERQAARRRAGRTLQFHGRVATALDGVRIAGDDTSNRTKLAAFYLPHRLSARNVTWVTSRSTRCVSGLSRCIGSCGGIQTAASPRGAIAARLPLRF